MGGEILFEVFEALPRGGLGHAGDDAALGALDEMQAEIELYRRHGGSYGYEMVLARRG